MFKRNQKGFTLIELMIVIAIIGILAAIAIPQFAAYRIRGFNSSGQSDVRNLATSEAAFFSDWQLFGNSQNVAGGPVNAAAAGGAGTLLTGPSTPDDFIGTQDANANPRGLNIGFGNLVDIIATTDANDASFTGAAKHLNGNTLYAVDSDTTALYQNPDGLLRDVGENMVVADCPASVAAADDFDGVGDWVAK